MELINIVSKMEKPILCHITTVHRIKDSRILYKQCVSLVKNNNIVYLIGSYEKDVSLNGVNIVALPFQKNRWKRMTKNTFFTLMKALRIKASVYHIHDPELIFCGFFLKLMGYSVIYDIHELVGEDLLTKNWIKPYFLRKVIEKLYKTIEFLVVKFYDAIILAEEGYAPYFKKYKSYQNKIHLVRNFPLPLQEKFCIDKKNPPDHRKKFIYIGGLGAQRGIKEIIQAISFVENAELWLLGSWESNACFEECKALPGWEKTCYFGECSPQEVSNYLSKADFGVCILKNEKNFSTSTPVKSFEYMLFGLPMIMSDFPLWRRYYENCALFVNPSDIKKIGKYMNKLLKNNNLARSMREECLQKVENFSWVHEEKKLLEVYKKLNKKISI